MWTPTWRKETSGLTFDGFTGIVGPCKIGGGRTRPMRVTQRVMPFYLIYSLFSLIFLSVGLTALSKFTSDVTSRDTSDQSATIDTR